MKTVKLLFIMSIALCSSCHCPIVREDRINENNKVTCGHCSDYSIFKNRIQDYCWRVLNNNKIPKE